MNKKSITIKDIATALSFSFSTVARALKGNYRISESTRKKITDYARENNYRPNLMAQGLKNQKSRSIGVLVCTISNSFFSEVLNGIESVAADKGYHVIISQSHESYEKEVQNLNNLVWRSVDGLLVSISAETKNTDHFQRVYDQNIPIVFFDRITDLINTHKVVADNKQGAYNLTRHLINNGYRRIAHITSSPSISITIERLEGYKQALTEAGIEPDEALIQYCIHGGMATEETEAAIENILNLETIPDALITASDRLTIKCFSLLKKRNISIPGKMAFCGFSNFSAAELFHPTLTTIVQPAFEMGKCAVELLIRSIESRRPLKEFEKRVLSTEMIIRESTTKTSVV